MEFVILPKAMVYQKATRDLSSMAQPELKDCKGCIIRLSGIDRCELKIQ